MCADCGGELDDVTDFGAHESSCRRRRTDRLLYLAGHRARLRRHAGAFVVVGARPRPVPRSRARLRRSRRSRRRGEERRSTPVALRRREEERFRATILAAAGHEAAATPAASSAWCETGAGAARVLSPAAHQAPAPGARRVSGVRRFVLPPAQRRIRDADRERSCWARTSPPPAGSRARRRSGRCLGRRRSRSSRATSCSGGAGPSARGRRRPSAPRSPRAACGPSLAHGSYLVNLASPVPGCAPAEPRRVPRRHGPLPRPRHPLPRLPPRRAHGRGRGRRARDRGRARASTSLLERSAAST